ncbi:calcium-binding protein [Leisingera methylohalidivorans]|nr:calcium-binding protein [Leisingera methylohalidivorans]
MPINSLQSRGDLVFFSEENVCTTWMYSPAIGLQHFPQYEMGATSEFHAPDGSVLLTSHNNETGENVLWATDGTPGGTIELMSGYTIRILSVVDGVVYVSHRVEGQEFASAIDGSGTLIGTADLPGGANWGLVQLGAFEAGTAGRDRMTGGVGDDTFLGLAGGDRLRGQGGDDVLKGHGGRDVLYGADGDDLLEGGAARDRLLGGRGNDTLKSGTGDDRLVGSSGHDLLQGQKGDDVLTGERGRDTFVFNRDDGNDTITDFELGIDLIEIGHGASRLGQLHFEQQGDDAAVSFRNVEITVENTTVEKLLGGDHFFSSKRAWLTTGSIKATALGLL